MPLPTSRTADLDHLDSTTAQPATALLFDLFRGLPVAAFLRAAATTAAATSTTTTATATSTATAARLPTAATTTTATASPSSTFTSAEASSSVAEAPSSRPTAAAATALLRLVYPDRAAVHRVAVTGLDRCLGVLGVSHGHESKATWPARITVGDDGDLVDLPTLGSEQLLELLLGCRERNIPNVKPASQDPTLQL